MSTMLEEYDCHRCGVRCFGICIIGNFTVCVDCFSEVMELVPPKGKP